MIDRRRMIGLFGSGLVVAMPGTTSAGRWPLRSGVRGIDQSHLWVRQAGRTEVLHTRFRRTGGYPDWEGIEALSWLFRDWRAKDQSVVMNIALFDLLATMQTLLSLVEDRPVDITLTSGYRVPERNATLEGAAIHSHHIYGRAADITLPGIPGHRVREVAELAGARGIGAYARFTHVDMGPPGRRW